MFSRGRVSSHAGNKTGVPVVIQGRQQNERTLDLDAWVVESELGQRIWQADDIDHALEQHRDAFPDESVTGAWLDRE